MFLDKTYKNLKGYVRLNVYGFFTERFLNLSANKNISLWDMVRKDNSSIIVSANIFDYKKLAKIAKETGCKINIEEKRGMPFYIKKHEKRKTFAIFFVLIILAIYAFNLHIWKVEISGEFQFSIEDIKKELEIENVRVGAIKSKLNLDEIKNRIYIRRHNIAWIGISFRGVVAHVEIIEGKLKEDDEMMKVPCNIVANSEGIICEIDVLEGVAQVGVGDYVNSGDILISGVVTSEWAEPRFVNSKGNIKIKKWQSISHKVPFEKDIITKTGKAQNDYTLAIKNNIINLINSGTNFQKYDTIITRNKFKLFDLWEFPIEFTKTTYEEIKVDTIKYNMSQAKKTAQNLVENEIQKLAKSKQIVKADYTTYTSKDGVTISAVIEYIEEIGIKKKLEGY